MNETKARGGMLGLIGGVVAVAGAVSLSLVAGCGDDTGTSSSTSSSSNGGCAPGEGCPAVESECIAFADNAGKDRFALRLSQLRLTAPQGLSGDPTVRGIVDKGISLAYPGCKSETGDALFVGDGTFSWILEFDTTTGTLRTGGALPEADPNLGYCFVNETIQGFDVQPFEISAPITNGGFETAERKDVVVPIYTSLTDRSKVILLPLRSLRIFGGSISADQNCVGSFNASGLDPNNLCLPDASTFQFVDGASIDGYITLEEADVVTIPELGGNSLCTLLAGPENLDTATKKCKRTGGVIDFKGDWCAGANEADPGTAATANCADSVKLAATFSASATTLRSCN